MKESRFERKVGQKAAVPTASMADIAFLLMIFFMVTTVLRLETGLQVALPKAEAAQRLERDKVAHIWVDRSGRISINDLLVEVSMVEPMIVEKLNANPALIISFNTDKQCKFGRMSDVLEELKKANATRVSFNAEKTN